MTWGSCKKKRPIYSSDKKGRPKESARGKVVARLTRIRSDNTANSAGSLALRPILANGLPFSHLSNVSVFWAKP